MRDSAKVAAAAAAFQQQQQQQQHSQQSAGNQQSSSRILNEHQTALLQTIKSVVSSVILALLVANIGIYYFVGTSATQNQDSVGAAKSGSSRATSQQGGDPACGIERRWAKNLSSEEFRAKYRLQKPVLLIFENGTSDWLLGSSTGWTLDSLASQFGSYEALVGRPIDIVRSGGRGQETVNFGHFMRSIRNASEGETRYIFSREFFRATHMDATLKFPPLMSYNSRDHDLFFFLGGNGSGAAFHRHADAWNAVVSGRKRWFLFPGDRAPPGGVHHAFEPRDWLSRVYTQGGGESRARLIQCDQQAGEILYIPEGFYHATINLEPTLAIGIQAIKPIGNMESLFYEMRNKSPADLEAIASKAAKLLPHNTEVLHKLAVSRKHQERYQEAEKLLEKILTLDANFLVAILDLAEIKWKFFSKTLEAEALYKRALELNPNLWEVHGRYGEFLAYQTGELEKAVASLEQAAKMRSKELTIWQLLRTIHDFAGNDTGAALAEEKIDQLSIIDDQLIDF